MNRIASIIALLLAFALAFAYVEPTWAGPIASVKKAISADDKAIEASKNYKDQEQKLVEEKNAIPEANLKRLNTFLPSSVDNIGLILDLNALAGRTNVIISDVTVENPVAAAAGSSPIGSVDLTLKVNGSYAAFQNFLGGIEKSARLIDVTNLTVNGSDTGVYTYDLKLRLYWLR